ncbi:PaaI family thioesterase [Oricola sp.]|uniref:PaaI family thioesterase n=1 Tax=Oricola sp. TaxID=1979950 RepID=UPI003BAAE196
MTDTDLEIYPGVVAKGGFGIIPRDMLATRSGLDSLRALIAGDVPAPPISKTLAFALVEVDEGRAVFKGMPSERVLNPLGVVHGGWAATLMDSALGCAVQTTLKPGEAYTTAEFKVNLLRPIMPDTGEVTCVATIVSRGRTIGVSECRVIDGRDRILAFGTETCSIFPIKQ